MTRELFIQNGDGAKLIAFAKNVYGRCAIHIAVLRENAEIVEFIAKNYPETLTIGDNVRISKKTSLLKILSSLSLMSYFVCLVIKIIN